MSDLPFEGYQRPKHMTTELSLEMARALLSHPEERFGQVIINALRGGLIELEANPMKEGYISIWEITDEQWASLLRQYARRGRHDE